MLADIADDARRSLDELCHVLGVLRRSGGGSQRTPLPTLANLTELITRVRAAGDLVAAAGLPIAAWCRSRGRLKPSRLRGRFEGRTVIVTGAGSGIRRATAVRVAREGARVIAVDLDAARLSALESNLGQEQVVLVVADITDDAGVRAIVDAAGEQIDGLANIAGIMDDMTPVGAVSDETWRRVFAVNVDGKMKLTRAVIPSMIKRGRGAVVNTASEAALRGSAAGIAYTASKHAVVGLTRSSAFMYGPQGGRIIAVAPGPTFSNIEANFASAFGADRVGSDLAVMPEPAQGEELAASIAFLLSDDGVNINGVLLPSDGGWSVA